MNRHLDQDTRKYLRDEAEWILTQELKAMSQIELIIVRLGYGAQAPRYIKSQGTDHSVIMTKRVVVYNPYTGIKRFGAQLLGLSVLPIKTLAWVIDSLIFGFTKRRDFGKATPPSILWDIVRYPGEHYSKRKSTLKTRKGGGRHVNR